MMDGNIMRFDAEFSHFLLVSATVTFSLDFGLVFGNL